MRTMRWLFVLPFLLPALVAAQEPPPAAAPPSGVPAGLKRISSQKVTGPSLASGKDEDFDEPPAPKEISLLPDEVSLLRAALWAFEPAPREIRVQAVEDLGFLGDARLLNVLAHLVVDPDQSVQLASVRAVRAIRSQRSEEILMNVVKHPNMPPAVKQSALEGLLFQNSRSALVFIWNVANNPSWGTQLYGVARRLLLDVPKDAWGEAT
jgi:hypothetical protein